MNAVQTTELKPVTVESENIIHLPLGLLGFEQMKKYVLLSMPGEAPFHWLQVLNDTSLAFLVLSPFEIMPDYQPELSDEDTAFIDLKSPQDALIWNIVTLRSNGRATINLKGPVVLNRFTLTGKQVVICNAAQYSLQHPLPVVDTTAS
jgi:flagellar assembly factor FliW